MSVMTRKPYHHEKQSVSLAISSAVTQLRVKPCQESAFKTLFQEKILSFLFQFDMVNLSVTVSSMSILYP